MPHQGRELYDAAGHQMHHHRTRMIQRQKVFETRLSYSHAKLNAVTRKLNEYPKKTLNYQMPAEKLDPSVASAG